MIVGADVILPQSRRCAYFAASRTNLVTNYPFGVPPGRESTGYVVRSLGLQGVFCYRGLVKVVVMLLAEQK
jgi:hypothetical protein